MQLDGGWTFWSSSHFHVHHLLANRHQSARVCVSVCEIVLRSPTCVEDTGGQRRRKALVQQEFAENHPGGLAREAPLQSPQPEVVEVAVESDGHHGHVARVPPVDALLLGDELVGKVTAGEQAAVQGDVGQPGEPFGGFFQHGSAHVCLTRGKTPVPVAVTR